MRLQAKEDEVYHLMDLKEWFSILIGLGSFFEGIALYFFIFRIRVWDLAYPVRSSDPWYFISFAADCQHQQTDHGSGILLYGTGTR